MLQSCDNMAALKACCSFKRKNLSDDVAKILNEPMDEKEEEVETKTYRRYWIRWLMLFVLFLLNLSNGTMWMTYAPIPGRTMQFFGISSSEVDWFSISFFITSLLVGFVSMFVLDTFGLAPSVISGAVLNFVGSVLRVLGAMPPVAGNPALFVHTGYLLAMTGQVLTACAQPFLLYSPTKFAMFWFGEKERSVANAVTSMANPLGIGLAYILSPRVGSVFTLSWIYMIPAACGCVLALATFWRGRPPTPPSAGAESEHCGFFRGLKQILRNKQMWVLLIVWGMVSGLLNSMLTLLPQFLCPFGYDNNFAGLWIGVMIFMGLAGALVASIFLDVTRRYQEVLTVAVALSIFCLIWFLEVFSRVGQFANVAVSLCAFGFFGFMVMPTTLEVAVEITYPAPEAASSGLLWSTSQIFGAVISFTTPFLVAELPYYYYSNDIERCTVAGVSPSAANSTAPQARPSGIVDYTYAVILYIAVAVVAFILLVLLFRPKYRRYEEELQREKKKNESDAEADSNSDRESCSRECSPPLEESITVVPISS